MNADELKAAFSNLPDILPKTTWDEHRLALRKHVRKDNLNRFLHWSTITATMFVGEAPYIEQELLQLMNHRGYWKSALSESDIGKPPRLSYAPWTSGNIVHQAYHLKQWLDKAKIDVRDLQWIVEFGGGYGALAKIVYSLGFNGVYTLVDFPEFLLLQEYYLSAHDISAEYVQVGQVDFQSGESDLFIALFSLSETDRSIRHSALPPAKSYLFAYQPEWGGTSNSAWFKVFRATHQLDHWWDWGAKPNPVYRYMVGV